MRKLLALVVAVAAVAVACGGTAPATTDPYEIVHRSQSATWDRVQVDVGITVTGPDGFTIPKGGIRFAADTPTGRVNLHVAIPLAALGDEAAMLRGFGVTGDTLELDIIYDGEALYVKSPLGSALALLMIQAGELPPGDMTGWLRLLSKEDLESLEALFGGGAVVPVPDELPIPSAADPASLRSTLDEMGITLTHAGTASRNGVDADRISVAIDLAKLAESEALDQLGAGGPLDIDPADGSLSADLWFDRGNGRLIGVDLHAASTTDSAETAEVTIDLREPGSDVSFEAPSPVLEVPLMELLGPIMDMFGGGLFPQ